MSVSSVNNNANHITKLYEKLSTGKKINSAADDPAGLAKAERMEAEIRKQQMQSRNYSISQAMTNVADGAYSGMASYAQDIASYETMEGNELYTDSDVATIDEAISSLTEGITDLESQTTFNTMQVIDSGTVDTSSSSSMTSSISSASSANGAYYNMLGYSSRVSSVMALNTTAALSRTEDTEYGSTVSELKKEKAMEKYQEELQRKRQMEEERRANLFNS